MSGQLLLLLLASVLTTDDRKGCDQAVVSNAEALKITMEERLKHKRLPSQLDSALLRNVRLSTEWAFWFEDLRKATPAGLSSEQWLKTLARLESFETYGDLMGSWNALLREAAFPASRLYLFKKGIRPLWEDKANANGGKLLLIIPEADPAAALETFLKVLVSIICAELAEQVCGLTCALREASTATLSVWTPGQPSDELREHLAAFATAPGAKIGFKPHKMCARQRKAATHKPAHHQHPRTRRAGDREAPSHHQKKLRPPPGFEGSAPSRSARSGVYQPPSLRHRLSKQQQAPAVVANEPQEAAVDPAARRQPAEVIVEAPPVRSAEIEQVVQPAIVAQEPPREVPIVGESSPPAQEGEPATPRAPPTEEEVKARKRARRKRQRENQKQKKRTAGGKKSSSSASSKSDSDSESCRSEDEPERQPLPAESQQQQQQPEPVVAKQAPAFRPSWRAVAMSVAALAVAAAPLVMQAL